MIGFRVRVLEETPGDGWVYLYGVATAETERGLTVRFDIGYVEDSLPRWRVEYASSVTEVA